MTRSAHCTGGANRLIAAVAGGVHRSASSGTSSLSASHPQVVRDRRFRDTGLALSCVLLALLPRCTAFRNRNHVNVHKIFGVVVTGQPKAGRLDWSTPNVEFCAHAFRRMRLEFTVEKTPHHQSRPQEL